MNAGKIGKACGSVLLTSVMVLYMPITAFAETYDIANGSIQVNAGENGQTVTQNEVTHTETEETVITGTSGADESYAYSVTITAEDGYTADVTFSDLSIISYDAPVTVSGDGDVNIELDGENTLKGYRQESAPIVLGSEPESTTSSSEPDPEVEVLPHAAIEKDSTGMLTINDSDNEGVLVADSNGGAGIGGAIGHDGNNITINGGDITAIGNSGAGIGGGYNGGNGDNITINGGTVTATGTAGAGIGGGVYGGDGTNITINGGTVNAVGNGGAGIGGGVSQSSGYNSSAVTNSGDGNNIKITGGEVTATGNSGAGIGGGTYGNADNISITGGKVTATAGSSGAGIGGGVYGNVSNITIKDAEVTAVGDGGAGIGGGVEGSASNIIITNSTVNATGSAGAGIGSGHFRNAENITINSGNITAHSTGGAGIGTGVDGKAIGITINGGTIVATTDDTYSAGIGGGPCADAENITINNGNVTATGGLSGAGIGGGAGNGDGINITITGGTVVATSGGQGAGIGGSAAGTGKNIKITGGNVTAISLGTGSAAAAGIGSGAGCSASDITITGGTVVASGGSTGIGGGAGGSASSITISGGNVTATGKAGAGIGGADGRDASDITLSGGTVIAVGSNGGAGVGSGVYGEAEEISISKAAKIYAAGSEPNNSEYGVGAAIGSGGKGGSGIPIAGASVYDATGLYNTGTVCLYEPGTTLDQIINGEVQPYETIVGTVVDPSTIVPDPKEDKEPVDPIVDPTDDPAEEPVVIVEITETEYQEFYENLEAGLAEMEIDEPSEPASVVILPAQAQTYEEFNKAVEDQINDSIKQLSAIVLSGNKEEIVAFVSKGIVIDAGSTFTQLDKTTGTLIEQVLKLGIPVTISFRIGDMEFSMVIPPNRSGRFARLYDKNGNINFLMLMKYFGAVPKKKELFVNDQQ